MIWKIYDKDNPPAAGKYIVKTKTSMGNIHRIESNFSGVNWSCTNQVVTEYLEEQNPDT